MATAVEPSDHSIPKRRTWTRFLIRLVLIYAIVPYMAVVVLAILVQRSLIYRPTKVKSLSAEEFVDLNADDIQIPVDDNLKLNGWHFPADQTSQLEQKFLVIYFPGNGGCRKDRQSDCREFAELGCDVILFDYRGYGDNRGSPSEDALSGDARRIWKFATETLKTPADRIVLFGESMGGAMATRLAEEQSRAATPPAALILNSTFASLGETVAWHYPAFPFQYFLWDRYPSVERIQHVTCPILQYHGTADEIVAFEHGQRLFRAAPAKSAQGIPAEFISIPGGMHNFISISDLRVPISRLLKRIGDGATE